MVLRIQAPGQGPGEQGPRLRPVAAPVDPYVTPGVQMPKLDNFNWKALTQLSGTLASAFRQAENRYDKEVRDFAESNEDILYALSRDANATLYTDPDSPEVQKLVKEQGIKGWQRPEVRERAMRILGTKTYNESGIIVWSKSREVVEAVARSMMDVPQGSAQEQQEAGTQTFKDLYEKKYEDVIGGIESPIAMASFRKKLTGLTLDVLSDAASLRDRIAGSDQQASYTVEVQAALADAALAGGPHGAAFKGSVEGLRANMKEMGKKYPSLNHPKLVVEALKAMGTSLATQTKLNTTEIDDFQHLLDQLSQGDGFLGDQDVALQAIKLNMDALIEKQQRRASSPEAASQMRDKVYRAMPEYFYGLLSDTPTSARDIQAHLLAQDDIKKMIDNGEITFETIVQIADKTKTEAAETEVGDLMLKVRRSLEGGDLDYLDGLANGTGEKSDLAAYNRLTPSQLARIDELRKSKDAELDKEMHTEGGALIEETLAPFGKSDVHEIQSAKFTIDANRALRKAIKEDKTIEEFKSDLTKVRDKHFPQYDEQVKEEKEQRLETAVQKSESYKTARGLQFQSLTSDYGARIEQLSSQSPEAAEGITAQLVLVNNQIAATSTSRMPKYIKDAREELTKNGKYVSDRDIVERAAQLAADDLPAIKSRIHQNNRASLERKFVAAVSKTVREEHKVLKESSTEFYPSMHAAARDPEMSLALAEYRADPKAADLEDAPRTFIPALFWGTRRDAETNAMSNAVRAVTIGRYLNNPTLENKVAQLHWKHLTQEAGGAAQAEMYAKTRIVQASYVIGLDLKSVASDSYGPSGMKLSTAFGEPGKGWRGNLDPSRIMFHTSVADMQASVEKAKKDPESVEARGLKNMGYDPADAEAMNEYISSQRGLLEPLESQPKLKAMLEDYRKSALEGRQRRRPSRLQRQILEIQRELPRNR